VTSQTLSLVRDNVCDVTLSSRLWCALHTPHTCLWCKTIFITDIVTESLMCTWHSTHLFRHVSLMWVTLVRDETSVWSVKCTSKTHLYSTHLFRHVSLMWVTLVHTCFVSNVSDTCAHLFVHTLVSSCVSNVSVFGVLSYTSHVWPFQHKLHICSSTALLGHHVQCVGVSLHKCAYTARVCLYRNRHTRAV